MALADLAPGTIVTVAGMGTSRQLSATFVAFGRNGVRVWLWAPLDFVQPPLLTAFGVPVTTSDSTRFFLAGHNRRSGSPSAFFETAELGRTVRIEGLYLNGTFVATRVCNVNSIRGSDLKRLLKIDD